MGLAAAKSFETREYPELVRAKNLLRLMNEQLWYEWSEYKVAWELNAVRSIPGIDKETFEFIRDSYLKAYYHAAGQRFRSADDFIFELGEKSTTINIICSIESIVGRSIPANLYLAFILRHICHLEFEHFGTTSNDQVEPKKDLTKILSSVPTTQINELAEAAGYPNSIDIDPVFLIGILPRQFLHEWNNVIDAFSSAPKHLNQNARRTGCFLSLVGAALLVWFIS